MAYEASTNSLYAVGARVISQAFGAIGDLKVSLLAAVDNTPFEKHSSYEVNQQYYKMGLNAPATETPGIMELFADKADEETDSKPTKAAPVTAKPAAKAKVKDRFSYKRNAPIQRAVAQPMFFPPPGAAMPKMPVAAAAGPAPEAAPAGGAVAPRAGGGAALSLSGLTEDAVLKKINEVAQGIIGSDEPIEGDTPLMQAGLTSNTAVLLRDSLIEGIPGITLPPTLIFDYPSMSGIADYIMGQAK